MEVLGTGSTFKFTTGTPLDFREFIDLIPPTELAAQNMYGSDGLGAMARDTSEQVKIEWQSEQLLLGRSALASIALVGDGTIEVLHTDEDFDHKLRFQTGSILKINDERLLVTGYDAAAGTLEVDRGFGDSTAAEHAADSLVREVGHALPEGSDPQQRRALDRQSDFNYHQIFGPVGVKVTGTRQAVRRFGVGAGQELAKQTANRLIEVAHSVEHAIFYGQRFIDTTEEVRTMGGLAFYISENVDDTSTDLEDSDTGDGPSAVVELLAQMYASGQRGRRLRAYHSPVQGAKIDTWDSTKIRLTRTDTVRGETVWSLATRYGTVDFIMSDHVDDTDMFIVDREQTTIKTLPGRDYQFVPEGRRGDYWEGFVVCEKSLEFSRPEHAGAFTNLTV
jgi:hypothetical protein